MTCCKMSSAKRKSLSIAEKAVILQRLQNGELNTMLAREYGVPHSTISSIKKNKWTIESLLHTNDPRRKRVRSSAHKQVEEALLQWTKHQSDQGIPVNGPMLLEKANFFGVHLNIPNFKCSLSWVNRFKVRHNVVGGIIACESPVESAITDWLTNDWPVLRAQFTCDNIYNANETELCYESEDKTLQFDLEKRPGSQHTKSRLTVVVAANMSGTVKKNLLVIGKSKCIKNLTVPVDYETNRRAWMTSDIFVKWLRAWDDYLTEKKEKIALLVDNSPVHVPINDLKNVTLVFLPPSMTSVLKPHRGIIHALQSNFQKNLNLRIADNGSANSPIITLLDAVLMTYDAWNALSPITIKDSFRQASLVQENVGCAFNSDFKEESISACAFELVKIENEKDTVTSQDSSDVDPISPYVKIKTEMEDSKDDKDNDNQFDQDSSDLDMASDVIIKTEVEDSKADKDNDDQVDQDSSDVDMASDVKIKTEAEDGKTDKDNDDQDDHDSSDVDMASDVKIKTEEEDSKDDKDNDDQDDGQKEVFAVPSISEALSAAEVLSVFVDSNFDDDYLKSMMSQIHNAVQDAYNQTKDNQN